MSNKTMNSKTMNNKKNIKRLIFFIDVTGSMGNFIPALLPSILQSVVINSILQSESTEIVVITYSDYDALRISREVVQVCGPHKKILPIKDFLDVQSVYGGGGIPEAFKTGMIDVLKLCTKETVVFHYTDAYPHSETLPDREGKLEKKSIPNQYWVWRSLCDLFQKTGATFVTFHTRDSGECACFRDLGDMVIVRNKTESITESTVDRMLSLVSFDETVATELFSTDEHYRNKCLTTFQDHILTETCVDSLRTNPVFLFIWRELNKFFRRDKLDALLDSMGNMASKRPWLSEMIQESYRDVEGVLKIIGNAQSQFPAFAYSGPKKDMKSVLNMCRMGDPESFMDLLQQSKVVMSGKIGTYIPLSLHPTQFLTVLSHLLQPGIKFSNNRSKWLLSGLIVSTCSEDHPLFAIAEEFLKKKTGIDVIDLSVDENGQMREPLNLSPFLPHLIGKMPAQFVSSKITMFYANMLTSLQLCDSMYSSISVTHSKVLNAYMYCGDKKECTRCELMRHESLIVNGVCGLCLQDCSDTQLELCTDAEKSYLYTCSECFTNYQVVNITEISGRPKCHQCRHSCKGSYKKICQSCRSSFKTYSKEEAEKKNWTCFGCNNGESMVEETEAQVLSLVRENSLMSIPKNFTSMKYQDRLSLFDGKTLAEPASVSYDSIPLHESAVSINKKITEAGREKDSCGICFSTHDHRSLHPICGNSTCRTKSCLGCLTSLYSQNSPGSLFNADLCPYCRNPSSLGVIKSVNKELFHLLKTDCVSDLNREMYHFWCKTCNHVKPYVQRTCAGETPTVENQTCVDCCQTKSCEKMEHELTCPSCKIPIEHVDGCNHLTCQCGVHFCRICLDIYPDGQTIYDHYDSGACPMYGNVNEFDSDNDY